MSERMTEVLRFKAPPSLYKKVEQAAAREGLSISAHLRRIATIWHDPDRATLEIPANRAILTDEPVPYEVET